MLLGYCVALLLGLVVLFVLVDRDEKRRALSLTSPRQAVRDIERQAIRRMVEAELAARQASASGWRGADIIAGRASNGAR